MGFPADLGELWRYRLKLTRRLLQIGLSVLLSDLDAYWLADPMPRLQRDQAHIVASQGTIHPRDVCLYRRAWCCAAVSSTSAAARPRWMP